MLNNQPPGSRGYDWTVVLLSFWLVAGMVMDGWAHNHIPELESFFTPWHAVFYYRVPRLCRFPCGDAGPQSRQGISLATRHASCLRALIVGVVIFIAGGTRGYDLA